MPTVYARVDDGTYGWLRRIAEEEDRPIGYIVARILKIAAPTPKPVKRKGAA